MRKIGLLIATGLTLSPAVTGIARADDAAIRQQVMSSFYKGVYCLKNKDVKSFMTMFSPGYTSKTLDGRTQNFADTEREMTQMMEVAQSIDGANMKIEKIRVFGYKAEVTSTMKLTVRITDKDGSIGGKKGDTHVMGLEERAKETWARGTDGRWKLQSSIALSGAKTTIDGKMMPTQMASARPTGKPTAKKTAKGT